MPAELNEGDPLARLLRALLAVDPARRLQSAFQLSGILDALGYARTEFRPFVPAKQPVQETSIRRSLSISN